MNHSTKSVEFVRKYLDGIFAEDVHAKRVMSLANGAVDFMRGTGSVANFVWRMPRVKSLETGRAEQHDDRVQGQPF